MSVGFPAQSRPWLNPCRRPPCRGTGVSCPCGWPPVRCGTAAGSPGHTDMCTQLSGHQAPPGPLGDLVAPTKPPDSRSKCRTPQHPLGTHQVPEAQWGKRVPGQGWPGWDSPCQPCPYLDKLHVTEDVHGVVGRVDVVAAAVELRAAASIVLPVGRLGAVEATAARR